MKDKFTNILAIIFGLIGLILLIILARMGISIFQYILSGFKELEPTSYIPLFVTLLTALLGLSAALYTQAKIRKRAIDEAHRAKKIEIYFGFIKMLQKQLLVHNSNVDVDEVPENDLIIAMSNFRTEISLWASPKVLNSFEHFMVASRSTKKHASLRAIDPIFRAMRNDIGLSNRGLDQMHFIKSMLSDPSELEELNS